jgi:predicted ABC-type ATPase
MERPPRVVIIAGPNGAGKSTVAPHLLRGALRVDEFVNADEIALGLSAFNPATVAIRAGRIMLARINELGNLRKSFAFETTLASRSFVPLIRELPATEFEFHLVYLWLSSPEEALARVAARVRSGGHNIPVETVCRRYHAGIRNFFSLYRPLTTSWQVLNNSGSSRAEIVAFGRNEKVVIIQPDIWGQVLKVGAA